MTERRLRERVRGLLPPQYANLSGRSQGGDIASDWFDGASKVAIVGGILVPEWTIEDMAERVRELTA